MIVIPFFFTNTMPHQARQVILSNALFSQSLYDFSSVTL
jgi:hypothetical protein